MYKSSNISKYLVVKKIKCGFFMKKIVKFYWDRIKENIVFFWLECFNIGKSVIFFYINL